MMSNQVKFSWDKLASRSDFWVETIREEIIKKKIYVVFKKQKYILKIAFAPFLLIKTLFILIISIKFNSV